MTTDKLYLANAALDLCGEGYITSLDDGSETARRCKLHIDAAIREVLEMGYWKCAKTEAVLVASTVTPVPQAWAYSFVLPVDYLRMFRVNDVDECSFTEDTFDVMGNQLLLDDDECTISYIRDLSFKTGDVGLITPMLASLISVTLAQKMAWGMTQSRTLRESLLQEARIRKTAALVKEAFEAKVRRSNPATGTEWLNRR